MSRATQGVIRRMSIYKSAAGNSGQSGTKKPLALLPITDQEKKERYFPRYQKRYRWPTKPFQKGDEVELPFDPKLA